MWRPSRLGSIIAERRLRLVRRRKRARTVRVRFGRPLRSPQAERKDPWWCPVEIAGLGRRRLRSIAGEDSLQALVLAFQFVTLTLPAEAERAGGRIEWLGEREKSGVCTHALAQHGERRLRESREWAHGGGRHSGEWRSPSSRREGGCSPVEGAHCVRWLHLRSSACLGTVQQRVGGGRAATALHSTRTLSVNLDRGVKMTRIRESRHQ